MMRIMHMMNRINGMMVTDMMPRMMVAISMVMIISGNNQ